MYLPAITEESNGLNLSKERFSSPYIINVINNTSQDKVATVFSANTQLQDLNNASLDGVVAFSGATLLNNLVLFGFSGNKQQFTLDLGANIFLITWNGTDSWDLLDDSHPIPNTLFSLFKDTELPIGSVSEWIQVTPSALIDFNTKREVQVNSSIPGVNYEQILQQSALEPFRVGLTQIYSSSLTQLLQPYQRVERDANGNLTKIPFIPTVDPYQNNVSLVEFNDEFTIDGNIGLQFNILANSSAKLLIFPNKVVMPQNELEGIPIIDDYKTINDQPKELALPKDKFSNFTTEKKTNYKPLIYSGLALLAAYLIIRKWD